MANRSELLSRVEIATPCTASWDAMEGSDRVRFCNKCNLNVYNLSAMNKKEAEQLIISNEGKLCARFYRRKDGTIITKDCPVGRWLRAKTKSACTLMACIFSWMLCLNRAQAIDSVQTTNDLNKNGDLGTNCSDMMVLRKPPIKLEGLGPEKPEKRRRNVFFSA